MDRQIVYPGQIPLETDLLNTNRSTMIALGKLAGALFGTGGMVNGLTVSPTSPAGLNVKVGAGEIYQLANVDDTAYSSLAADTTDTTVKQGILLQPATLACAAPGTAGFSINYLIEAKFQESDTGSVVLPYYNASNPQQAYSGPNNTGAAQAVTRAGTVSLQAKAGIAATTGTQTTPALDAGYIALAVVTVANGQTTITSSNITAKTDQALPADILHALQSGATVYAADTGAANAYAASYVPAVTALTDGMKLRFKAANANSGASTFSPNGLTAHAILGGAHAALSGGEISAGSEVEVTWSASLSSWVITAQSGGSAQIKDATQTNHAVTLGQIFNLKFQQQFTASGNFTVPAGVHVVKVRIWGGGGGGGGTTSSTTNTAAAGGAGGGYREGLFGVNPGDVIAVTVGAGGAHGGNGTAGATGGTSSFGSFITASGGGGGAASASGNAAGNNAGGVGTGGTMGIIGQGGGGGINYGTSTYEGGAGGAAFGSCQPVRAFGTPALGTNGNSGFGPGGGGSGGCCGGIGGDGAAGLVIVEY